MLDGLAKAGEKRRTRYEDLSASSPWQQRADGRFSHHFWDGSRRRYVYRYRWLWESANGPIPDGFELHHVNGDPSDDRLENLRLLTKREHRTLHAAARR